MQVLYAFGKTGIKLRTLKADLSRLLKFMSHDGTNFYNP